MKAVMILTSLLLAGSMALAQSTHPTEDAQGAQSDLAQTRKESLTEDQRARAKKFIDDIFGSEDEYRPRAKSRASDRPDTAASAQ